MTSTFTPWWMHICNAEGEPVMHVEFERSAIQKFADQVKIAKELGQFVVLTVEEAESVLLEMKKPTEGGAPPVG